MCFIHHHHHYYQSLFSSLYKISTNRFHWLELPSSPMWLVRLYEVQLSLINQLYWLWIHLTPLSWFGVTERSALRWRDCFFLLACQCVIIDPQPVLYSKINKRPFFLFIRHSKDPVFWSSPVLVWSLDQVYICIFLLFGLWLACCAISSTWK